MKCISLIEPWGSLVGLNYKRVETRSWKTNYRGELYIHVSKKTDKNMLTNPLVKKVLEGRKLSNGYIIAKCNLIDCIKMDDKYISEVKNNQYEYEFGEYKEGRYAWILDDVQLLNNPIPSKGKLGIWNYNECKQKTP